MSGYLPPAAAAELVKEAQVRARRAARRVSALCAYTHWAFLARPLTSLAHFSLAGPRARERQSGQRVRGAPLRRGAGRWRRGLGGGQRARARAALCSQERVVRLGRGRRPDRKRLSARARWQLPAARPRHGLRGGWNAGRGAAGEQSHASSCALVSCWPSTLPPRH